MALEYKVQIVTAFKVSLLMRHTEKLQALLCNSESRDNLLLIKQTIPTIFSAVFEVPSSDIFKK